jgi:hypothetical protein
MLKCKDSNYLFFRLKVEDKVNEQTLFCCWTRVPWRRDPNEKPTKLSSPLKGVWDFHDTYKCVRRTEVVLRLSIFLSVFHGDNDSVFYSSGSKGFQIHRPVKHDWVFWRLAWSVVYKSVFAITSKHACYFWLCNHRGIYGKSADQFAHEYRISGFPQHIWVRTQKFSNAETSAIK